VLPFSNKEQKLTIEGGQIKGNIQKYMHKKGLRSTPLDFIRLVQSDPELASRFAYCNRIGEFYDFVIVPFKERRDEEYLTVSQKGIVHFIKGEANFLTISEWERETRIYKKIQNIPFF
jgi:dynein heavy chain